MQAYQYTNEVIDRLNAFARTIPPSPPVRYALMHPEVQVPFGYLPIQIIQFSEWNSITEDPIDDHWSIFVPTSSVEGLGHHYELVGQPDAYYVGHTIDNYNVRWGLERGSHTIGYILPVMLPFLEAHFARLPIDPNGFWNSQFWAWRALQGLNHPHMFAVGIALEDLAIQMAIVSTAWELGTAKPTVEDGMDENARAPEL